MSGVWSRETDDPFAYSDGDHNEEKLLAAVRGAADVSLTSDDLTPLIDSWPMRYHLSAARAHLLRPVESSLGRTVLELGAGCGAITRWLGESGREVVAVEGSLRRATICRERCRGLKNVTVICERIERLPLDMSFDTVTLIGVLEYAAAFGLDVARPDRFLLERARGWCSEQGVLALAIENRLGLKYWAGAPEDHLGVPLVGVHGAYLANGPRTYSNAELKHLLESVGFSEQAFLLPFPDYKLPSVVLYPRATQAPHQELAADLIRFSNRIDPQPYDARLSTEALWPALAREAALPMMANSFLVITGGPGNVRCRDLAASPTLAVHFGGERTAAFRKRTTFIEESGRVIVERRKDVDREARGARCNFPEREELMAGQPWAARLHEIVRRDNWRFDEVVAWANVWLQRLLRELPVKNHTSDTVVPANLLDAGPQNLLVDRYGESHFVDLEWSIEQPITLGFVVFRSMVWSLLLITWSAPTALNPYTTLGSALPALFSGMGLTISDAALEAWLAQEERFQTIVVGKRVRFSRDFLRQRWGGQGRRRRSDGSDLLGIDSLDVVVSSWSDGRETKTTTRVELENDFVRVEVAIAGGPVSALRIQPTTQLGFFKLRALEVHGTSGPVVTAVDTLNASQLALAHLAGGDIAVACAGNEPRWDIDFTHAPLADCRLVMTLAHATEADVREASLSLHAAHLATASALDAERRIRHAESARSARHEAASNAAHLRLSQIEAHPLMRAARRMQRIARRVTRRS